MEKVLDELLWARFCLSEVVGSSIVGMLVGAGLQLGRVGPLVSSLVAAGVGVVVFSLLVGERLTRTPE